MKHISYPSTDQFAALIGNINRTYNFEGLDENGKAIYNPSKPKPVLDFVGTVKLHGCFDKNTLVTMANGEEVPISEINVGDTILSYDIANKKYVEKEVTNTGNCMSDKTWLKLHFDNNTYIECTSDHKFYTTNRGWVEAKDLLETDEYVLNSAM